MLLDGCEGQRRAAGGLWRADGGGSLVSKSLSPQRR